MIVQWDFTRRDHPGNPGGGIRVGSCHDKFETETRTSLNNQAAQLRNLEVQLGQMASLLSKRQQGNFPSTSEVNPRIEGKEHYKVVTLRNGKTLEQSIEA